MKYTAALSLLIILSQFIWGQNIDEKFQSKHKTDAEKHVRADYIFNSGGTTSTIIPLKQTSETNLTHSVFGYLPYWEYPDALDNLQYELLSHIAIFDFSASVDGSLVAPPNWPWDNLIISSHENGVKVIMTIVNFTGSQVHTLMTDTTVKSDLFANILDVLQQYNLDGVNIDFEGVAYSDRGIVLNNFMLELTTFLQDENEFYEVSFAAPPVNWGGWDFPGLAASCDYLFIMGYNFYGPWSNTSGACAPLTGGAYNITNVIIDEYIDVVQNDPQKLILGVPYYGNRWITQSTMAYSNVIDHISQPTYEIAMNNAEQDTLIWDGISQTSWSYEEINNSVYQTWFDNDSSLCLKYSLAENNLLKGVGMWALGYDGSRPELWDEIREHFASPVMTEEIDKLAYDINVYPVPTDGIFNIKPINIDDSFYYRIIDIRGNEIIPKTYFRNNNSEIKVDMSSFDSGMYFIILTGLKYYNPTITKKILLQ